MRRKKKKLIYILTIRNKLTNELVKVIEYYDAEQADYDNIFYNNTENLKSDIKTISV